MRITHTNHNDPIDLDHADDPRGILAGFVLSAATSTRCMFTIQITATVILIAALTVAATGIAVTAGCTVAIIAAVIGVTADHLQRRADARWLDYLEYREQVLRPKQ